MKKKIAGFLLSLSATTFPALNLNVTTQLDAEKYEHSLTIEENEKAMIKIGANQLKVTAQQDNTDVVIQMALTDASEHVICQPTIKTSLGEPAHLMLSTDDLTAEPKHIEFTVLVS